MNVPNKSREFMTTWHASARSYLPAWAQRSKALPPSDTPDTYSFE
jgi:hypothetical protein